MSKRVRTSWSEHWQPSAIPPCASGWSERGRRKPLCVPCVMSSVYGDRVEFVGNVDPRPHYWAADLVVLPSRWEGQSLVLLEAMACGATVIASSAAGSGFGRGQGVVEVGGPEVDELVQAITEMLTSPATCRELGDRARATVEERHSTSRVIRDYLRSPTRC